MPNVTNLSLAVSKVPGKEFYDCVVKYGLQFDAADVGKKYAIQVQLFAHDPPGDEPEHWLDKNELIGTFGFLGSSFTTWTVDATDVGKTHMRERSRKFSAAELNEDVGQHHQPGEEFPQPKPDEVKARVMVGPYFDSAVKSVD